ncbi:hypothetical protein [Corynebacterium pelargi]|uniref:Uncharacterized protein n=1 Tax=Corynebacterium pelargi TaxID=1471400 RepID=A0A410W7Q2_9CORY|nr:hypothetical protein [Corynebacterium pelargi]QAU51985.1 hypothetical protein CPELA_03530 [Corynebacterium pelargi]GGG70987.1 hypothetical protein GCM10007338_04930 [Corynebacterium pelargi]
MIPSMQTLGPRRSSRIASLVLAAALPFAAAPMAQALEVPINGVPDRTQITVDTPIGVRAATPNADQSRPALSLSKLYLGYWVLHHGAAEDKAKVETMIRFSDDRIATELDRKYPQAIPEVIAQFGLGQTHYNGFWGNTTTSTNDMARFLQAIALDPVAWPLINGMRTAAPVAADGYRQDYGTATLPGIWATKFGWSDDRQSVHASASFGPGFVVAANTFGPAAQLTQDVQQALSVQALVGQGSSTVPAVPLWSVREQLRGIVDPSVLSTLADSVLVPLPVLDALLPPK